MFIFQGDGNGDPLLYLAWKIPRTEEPGRLQSMGSGRVGHDWATSLSLFTFMHWRRKWQPTPVFLPGESQGRGSLVGCHLWGRTELDIKISHLNWSHLAGAAASSKHQVHFNHLPFLHINSYYQSWLIPSYFFILSYLQFIWNCKIIQNISVFFHCWKIPETTHHLCWIWGYLFLKLYYYRTHEVATFSVYHINLYSKLYVYSLKLVVVVVKSPNHVPKTYY